MCRVDPEWYHQVSPVSVPQACAALRFLARFHAAAMGNKVVMEAAHRWLHPRGGTWTLDKRGRGTGLHSFNACQIRHVENGVRACTA